MSIEQIRLEIEKIKEEVDVGIRESSLSKDIEQLKVSFLGKKGPIVLLMQTLKNIPKEEKPLLGKEINQLKVSISNTLESALEEKLKTEECFRLKNEWIDVTLPGRNQHLSRCHVIRETLDQVLEVLSGMGFSVQLSPDIENDFYNFEALNFPDEHPARDMQDTFFISENILLRTHTSNTQVRIMETFTPPIRVAAPGKCFRNETITARSHVVFHQVEGFYIDENVSFADLVATLNEFFNKLFQSNVKIRTRPSYFPFVEPGMEVDIHCLMCKGQGCSICKKTGWLEVAGAGMIHPKVLIKGGIDPEKFSGYAWGMGIERMVMLRSGIQDIRLFNENNVNFLNQFN